MSEAAANLLAEHFDQSLGLQRRLRLPNAVIATLAATSAALLLWAALAPVDRMVHMQGRVIPSGKQQMVQHLEGGIVSRVFVREGDRVESGQSLIAVSDLQASSVRGEKGARLDGLLARAARLQAESQGLPRFDAPAGLGEDSAPLRSEREAFDARQGRLLQSLRVLDEQISQRQQEFAEQKERRKGLESELATAQKQATLVETLISHKAGSQLELLEARARVERLTTQLREIEAAGPRLAAAASETAARRAEAVAQFRSEARTALADARVELQQLQQEINAVDDRVRRTVVAAPVAGRVNKLMFNTVGGVVKPGDLLVELTPEEKTLVVETRVAPQERGPLREGQRAVVKVAAFDYTVFGTLEAQVREISADSLADERGERYFRVSLAVDADSLARFQQPLSPGMTVTADAVTGRRTVLQYLLSPIRGLSSNAFQDRK
ncbi:MAG: HlyD family type I secretion periplasmic adaptor subunit [Steroidobacteraceae bacterium]